ncbi:MAG: hypothetical protein RIG26_06960 [Thalassospira sp.]|uniref:hypothetical protein n=1 Tax=Thalassospira sp. TaxID=1912094 RepID=UPI0032EC5F34
MIKVSKATDSNETVIRIDDGVQQVEQKMNAYELEALIANLASMRAEMTPVHSGQFVSGYTASYECDNLLWSTMPDPGTKGLLLAFQNEGLGWITLRMSRAQLEDLVTNIEFSLLDLSRALNRKTPDTTGTGPDNMVPIRS